MADIPVRVEKLEETSKEQKGKLEELDGTLNLHQGLIQSIEEWRAGANGSRGAEVRLQTVEQAVSVLPVIAADLAVVKMVADAKLQGIESSITNVLDRRDKTVIAYLRALGPLVAGLAAIALALLSLAGVRL